MPTENKARATINMPTQSNTNEPSAPFNVAPTGVLITGASSALGRAIAQEFLARFSSKILMTSRSSNQNQDSTNSDRIKWIESIDLTSDNDLARLARAADAYFPTKFSVINVVGQTFMQKPLHELTLDEARSLIDSNYLTVYGVAKYILPLMITRGGGHFVAFGCNSVQHHYPLMSAYTASKAAVQSFTSSLANEFAKDGIVANSFALSTLQTRREFQTKPHGDHEHWLDLREVASAVGTLVADPSGLINGNAISLFRYSDSFFHDSYFGRIRRE